MTTVDILGWTGAVVGTLLGVPQLVRLHRTRNIQGLSLLAWQAMLAVNLGWIVHGLRIGQAPQWVTSVLALASTVPILYLMSKELQRRFIGVLLPGLAAALVVTIVDLLLGSAAYGVIAVVPAVVTSAGQTVELVRSEEVVGVSAGFLVLGMINQCLWLAWAFMVSDPGTIIVALATGAIGLFNLVWYVLRRQGMRPLLA